MHSAVVHRHQYQRANKTIMHSLPISRCWTEHCIHLKLTARMHALNWAAPSFADLGTLTVPHFLCVSRDFIALQTCVWACLFESFNIFIWRKKKYCRISSYTLYLTYKTCTSVHVVICLFFTEYRFVFFLPFFDLEAHFQKQSGIQNIYKTYFWFCFCECGC